MCKKDKCCCPKKKKVAGKKRRGKVGKARLNATQIMAMASVPRASPAVPLYTNNPLGEDQLTKQMIVKEREPIVLVAPPAPKALDISRKADKPDRKMKSMVAEALAPPMFASTQAPPQTIALPPRAPIAPSVEFAPPVAQALEQTKKPMYAEPNRTDLVNLMTKATPKGELRQGKRTVEFGEGTFKLVQQRGGAREGAGRPPNSLRLPPPL